MSKTTFTPGPWKVACSNNATPHILHTQHDNPETDIDDHDQIVCIMPAEIRRTYNSLPNAFLIAAAPEMHEMLEKICEGTVLISDIYSLLNRITP